MNNNNSSTGMNNYLNQQKKEDENNTVSQSLTPPNNVSGGQGAGIGGGSTQKAPQAPKAPKKQASSGMFNNLSKYIERNKQGAQQMSGKLQQNVAQQNQNIQQAIGKQKNDFMSRVNANRNRLDAARGFGEDAVGRAGGVVNKDQLANERAGIESRIGQFDYSNPSFENYNYYLENFTPIQQPNGPAAQPLSYQDYISSGTFQDVARGRLSDASRTYQDTSRSLTDALADNRFSRGENQGYYSAKEVKDMGARGYEDSFLDNASKQIQDNIDNMSWLSDTRPLNEQEQAQVEAWKNDLSQIDAYRQATQTKSEAQTRLENLQDNLNKYKLDPEMQRLVDNRRNLQLELAKINDKIENAPEQLTDDEIKRFNALRTGVERYDKDILNLSKEQGQVGDLMGQAEALGTSQGRRDLMRKQFGAQGGYTAGQSALDNLILTGDKGAMRELVTNAQAQAQQAEASLQEAFKKGRITQDEMRIASDKLKKDLNEMVEKAQDKLVSGSEEYQEFQNLKDIGDIIEGVDVGYMTRKPGELHDMRARSPFELEQIKNAREKLEEAGYSMEDLDRYLELRGKEFTADDMGLTGRAATGEGTMLKRLQDKLASGQGLSAEELNILGLTEDDFLLTDTEEMLRNIQIDPETFSIQDVATSQDVARAEALARLAGGRPEDYLVNELGLEQSALDRIKSRESMSEGEKYATVMEELSPYEQEKLKEVATKAGSTNKQIKDLVNKISSNKNASRHALGERSREGGGTPHWKHWNHYYVVHAQEAAKYRRQLQSLLNKGKAAGSESKTQEQALQDFLAKYNV